MKTLTIPKFISDLNELTSSFENKSLSEYKRLLDIADRAFKLIHGRRSERENNYRLLPIERELLLIVFELRKYLLKKMFEDKIEYQKKEPREFWEDFKLASSFNYGSFGHDGIGWSSEGLAEKAKDMLFELHLDKLTGQLSQKPKSEDKTKALKILHDMRDHYNPGHKNYKMAHELLKKYDTEKEFIKEEYFA